MHLEAKGKNPFLSLYDTRLLIRADPKTETGESSLDDSPPWISTTHTEVSLQHTKLTAKLGWLLQMTWWDGWH